MLKPFIISIIVISAITLAACIEDIDFDQAEDIVLRPQVEADLIFFSLQTDDFINQNIQDTTFLVSDTTRLEFLNDSFLRENINQVIFRFDIENSFAQSFTNRSVFLGANGLPQYSIEFTIAPSPDGSDNTTTIIEQLNQEEIQALLNATQVVNDLEINTNGLFIGGALSLQSKALYSLELSDF